MNKITQPLKITSTLASQLIHNQFPEFAHLPITSVTQQGHDNRTYRLGKELLIRLPTAEPYALKVPIEQKLLPLLEPHLATPIPAPLKMGQPSKDFPFHFSIYRWLEGDSANLLKTSDVALEDIATQLARFLKTLQSISTVEGPAPGQHNWWRGDHVSVYDNGARQQFQTLADIIDSKKILALWEKARDSQWALKPAWIHGDFASGNILIKDNQLAAVIDFGGMALGDPACDLVIAWTFLHGKSREVFIKAMEMDSDTWLRAKAWCLWKTTFELCQIQDKSSNEAAKHKSIIDEILV